MAAVEKLMREHDVVGKITTAAGLSLGEYSALCFAGAFDFETGVRLTHARGRAMQKASDLEPSGMVSVIGLTQEQALDMCKQVTLETGSPITIANLLSDRNYALSGGAKACAFVAQHARKRFGARMAVKLAVSGAFHTAYMKPAEAALREVIEAADIGAPVVDVVSNVDVKIHRDPAKIKEILVRQLTSPVQWEATIKAIVDNGLEQAYECGPGQTLSTMLKRSNPEVKITTVSV
jgi:[acyl-carrier-protein] S-malonyltransferase